MQWHWLPFLRKPGNEILRQKVPAGIDTSHWSQVWDLQAMLTLSVTRRNHSTDFVLIQSRWTGDRLDSFPPSLSSFSSLFLFLPSFSPSPTPLTNSLFSNNLGNSCYWAALNCSTQLAEETKQLWDWSNVQLLLTRSGAKFEIWWWLKAAPLHPEVSQQLVSDKGSSRCAQTLMIM